MSDYDLSLLTLERRRYQAIPIDPVENLKFRRDLFVKCHRSQKWRDAITEICRNDPVFFFSAMCWCFEPRPRFLDGTELPKEIPFITWPHQVPVIEEIYDNLGYCDIGVEKSRGEGLSWIGILLAMHDWLFNPMTAIGLVSKDEPSVSDQNNPDSLFWKCQYTLDMLPDWLSGLNGIDYKRDISKVTLTNLRNGASLAGFAATGNVASGGRKRWFLMDELGKFPKPSDRDAMNSTQHVTECRLAVSTPFGADGAYFDAMHEPSSMVKIIVDWKDNPLRSPGLYFFIDGKPVACDPIHNPLLAEYDPPSGPVIELLSRLRRKGYKIEGVKRSPWYDGECDRMGASPTSIAQELDRDYGGSAHRIFPHAFFSRVGETAMAPLHEGELNFRIEKIDHFRFDEMDGGPIKLWVPLDALGNPPARPYSLGADVAAGTGGSYSSNSTAVIKDMISNEQVLEYACNTIQPADFGELCIAFCKWFHNAFMGWEHNGPGSMFTKRVLSRQYANIYYRKSLSRRGGPISREAGWWTDERTKEVMFGDLISDVIAGNFIIRSNDLKIECGRYVRKEGKITNALIKSAADDSRGASHGDRAIGAAVMVQASKERPIQESEDTYAFNNPPLGSMAARMKEYEERETADQMSDGWISDNHQDTWV